MVPEHLRLLKDVRYFKETYPFFIGRAYIDVRYFKKNNIFSVAGLGLQIFLGKLSLLLVGHRRQIFLGT